VSSLKPVFNPFLQKSVAPYSTYDREKQNQDMSNIGLDQSSIPPYNMNNVSYFSGVPSFVHQPDSFRVAQKRPQKEQKYHGESTTYASHFPPQSESDFLTIFKCMRTWQKFTAECKRKRFEHSVMIEHMATAINYHEQSLRTKALLSFIQFRVTSERERQLTAGCKSRVRHNMLRWYFQAIVRKYQEIRWIESGKQIAMLYKVKVTLRKVLYAW
jgi:hypothetical protein